MKEFNFIKRSFLILCQQELPFISCTASQSQRRNARLGLTCKTHTDSRSIPVPLRLHFDSYDPPKPSHKNPTVILHGLLGSRSNWKSLAKVIAARSDRKVYVLDARNHGDSPHVQEHDYFSMAADVELFFKEHGIQKCVLLGHSMGGRTAMVTALQKASLVEKLVIVDVSPLNGNDTNVKAQASLILDLMTAMRTAVQETPMDAGSLTEVRRAVDQRMAHDIKDIALRQFVLTNLTEQIKEGQPRFGWRVNLQVLENSLRSKILLFPSSLDGSVYAGPTLFLCGGNSNYLSPDDHPAVQKFFPCCQIEYIEGAGHWVHAEKPTEFLDKLLPFL